MSNFSRPISTINGFINLGTAMRAAGYRGGNIVSSLGIYNPDGTNLVHLHLTDNGQSSSGLTGTDGWPIGATGAPSPAFFSDRGANQSSLDIGTTWIYAGTVIALKVIATGT